MLGFAIPVRPFHGFSRAEVARDYLESTLSSILNQDTENWRVFLSTSGDYVPPIDDPRILHGACPDALERAADTHLRAYRDMHRKRRHAARMLADMGCSHVMFLDADDLVSRQLVSYVLESGKGPMLADFGWILIDFARRVYLKESGFAFRCGSSVIADRALLESDAFLGSEDPFDAPFYHHHMVNSAVKARADKIPFPSVVYRTESRISVTRSTPPNTNPIVARGKRILRLGGKLLLSQAWRADMTKEFGHP